MRIPTFKSLITGAIAPQTHHRGGSWHRSQRIVPACTTLRDIPDYPQTSRPPVNLWTIPHHRSHWHSVPAPTTVANPLETHFSQEMTSTGALRIPELLAPAGDWECARAAVENGADAIYFGLDRFNARMRAHNFTEADLPALMEYLHRRGVRGYVTFNTLVFTEELPAATEYLRAIIRAGVDAAIVQDIGICRLIRRLSPDFPIHGSTQMTITSVAGVEFARELGCNLVVLARESSIRDIRAIQAAQQPTPSSTPEGQIGARGLPPLDLEVFVHGALCVAYSGQCLTSEALGGRSANRGECAQACRLPYDLISDGRPVDLGDRRYLLSPQDLAGLEVLDDLVLSGVSSLKIEGRLKSPEYVASITRVYRDAIDRIRDRSRPNHVSEPKNSATSPVLPPVRYELEMAFSRGLYTGWFRGINNQELVHARFGKKRGVLVGDVTRVDRSAVWVRPVSPVKLGDGVVFDAGKPEEREQGGRIYEIYPDPRSAPAQDPHEIRLSFGRDAVDFSQIQPGDRIWKTSDPELEREIRRTYEGETPKYQRPLTMEVHGHSGSPLTLIARDAEGHVAQVQSGVPLTIAERQPLSSEKLQEQLGRLGGTPFQLGDLKNHLSGNVILPISELNRLRRDCVKQLEALRAQPRRWTLTPGASFHAVDAPRTPLATAPSEVSRELIVLVRDMAQLEAAIRCGVETLYCDFEDPKKYREAVRSVRESNRCDGPVRTVWVAPPRITKPGEEWILKQVLSSDADGYLVRNADHLNFFSAHRRVGDFSLNVANPLTAEWFIQRHALERVTLSYDLNVTQLESLVQAASPSWFEVTLHQHMPMFHMEHCVFCAFLSSGTDFTNCGRPCDRHRVSLKDRVGREHPLKADAGCRNTVFNARAQTGAEYLDRFLTLGLRQFRIEFVQETPEEVTTTIARYRALLRGELSGSELWRELRLDPQLGVTRGQMDQVELRKVQRK
jgi:putative protease